MNGGDWILSPKYSYFSMKTVAIFRGFKIENRSFSLHCPDLINVAIDQICYSVFFILCFFFHYL